MKPNKKDGLLSRLGEELEEACRQEIKKSGRKADPRGEASISGLTCAAMGTLMVNLAPKSMPMIELMGWIFMVAGTLAVLAMNSTGKR